MIHIYGANLGKLVVSENIFQLLNVTIGLDCILMRSTDNWRFFHRLFPGYCWHWDLMCLIKHMTKFWVLCKVDEKTLKVVHMSAHSSTNS